MVLFNSTVYTTVIGYDRDGTLCNIGKTELKSHWTVQKEPGRYSVHCTVWV